MSKFEGQSALKWGGPRESRGLNSSTIVKKAGKVSPLKLSAMDSSSVAPVPELAPIAEFDKTPPTPPHDELPMDDLPPPPSAPALPDDEKKR